MPSFLSSSCRASILPKACVAAFMTAASLLGGSTAFSQGYATTFDNYTNGGSLSGQDGGTGVPWDTNDPDKTPTTTGYGGEYVGQADYVGTVTNYSNPSSDYWAYLGGGQNGTAYPYSLPGSSTIYDYRPFTLGSPSGYAFNVDMSIGTTTNSAFPNRDSFAWTFLSSASGTTIGTNLFSLNFTPDTSTSLMDVGYTVNGGALVPSGKAIFYNSVYHLTISVNVTTKTASVSLTPTSGTAVTIATIALASTSPGSVQEVAATWVLADKTDKDANGGYTGAGGNELLFNNYAVTVPEPSTWAMMGLGLVAVGVFARRRVHA